MFSKIKEDTCFRIGEKYYIRVLSIDEKTEAVCWRTADGCIQPTFGWYSVNVLPALEKDIKDGKYKLVKSLEKVRCRIISTSSADMDDRIFTNINSEEE